MISEGRLLIEIPREAGDGGVRITSSRPLHLTRSFAGKRVENVAGTLPLIFSVCGMAQGAAAAGAAGEALGIVTPPETTAVRGLLVLAETAREHFIRAVRDWPRFAGAGGRHLAGTGGAVNIAAGLAGQPHLSAIVRWDRDMRKALGAFGPAFTLGAAPDLDVEAVRRGIGVLTALLDAAVYGESSGVWLTRTGAGDLTAWAGAQDTAAQCLFHRVLSEGWSAEGAIEPDALPDLSRDALAARLFGDDATAFTASPAWDGIPRESTPLTRERRAAQVEAMAGTHGCGLGARIAASLVELARIPERMEALLPRPPVAGTAAPSSAGYASPVLSLTQTPHGAGDPACGIAQVEAVRGRLVHGVEQENGLVRRYVIVAPTEWNFHPQGAAMRGLAAIAASRRDGWQQIADLFIATVDPCVGYELRVG